MSKKTYASPPPPINLNAPEHDYDYEPRRRERFELPELDDIPIGMPRGKKKEEPREDSRRGLGVFKAAQKSYGAPKKRPMKMPPPPPPLRPGDMQRRKQPSKVTAKRRSPIRINPMVINIFAWGSVAIVAIAITVWFIMGLLVDNAFAVYLDNELIGYIPINDTLTSEEFHNHAVLSLQASRGGVRARVVETVTIEPARASASERMTSSDMTGLLNRRFTYEIAATAVYVNDTRMALMRTVMDLEHLERLLRERWYNEYTVRSEFVDRWSTEVIYVDPETEFDTSENAYWRLDVDELQIYTHTIQEGENLSIIAIRFGTTVNNIMRDNGLTSPNIFPGNQLQILTYLPLLAVRTFDEITHMEIIEMPVQEIETPNLPLAFTNVIQEGHAGQQQVTTVIIRESGIEVSRETLEAEVVVEPITHIVEVGTGAASVEIR